MSYAKDAQQQQSCSAVPKSCIINCINNKKNRYLTQTLNTEQQTFLSELKALNLGFVQNYVYFYTIPGK